MKHLIPAEQVERHRPSVGCDCRPDVSYVETGAGMRPAVAVHRRLADPLPDRSGPT